MTLDPPQKDRLNRKAILSLIKSKKYLLNQSMDLKWIISDISDCHAVYLWDWPNSVQKLNPNRGLEIVMQKSFRLM